MALNLILQVNTDEDTMEVFSKPVGHTTTDGIEIVQDIAKTMGLTEVGLTRTPGNEESVGDYTARLIGNHPDGYSVVLYVQDLQNLDS